MRRRVFLKNGAFALFAAGMSPSFLSRTMAQTGRHKDGRILVCIFQRGAVDGVSMVIPFGDKSYSRSRRSTLIPLPGQAGGALDLDGFFGLNPGMEPLIECYDKGELAIIQACGSHDPTRSHFDAQDYMEAGIVGMPSQDGWLNRHLQTAQAEAGVFRAVSIGGGLPRSLAGAAPALGLKSLSNLGLFQDEQDAIRLATLSRLYQDQVDILGGTAREALDAISMAQELDPNTYAPENGVTYPNSSFGRQMREIAQLIKGDVGLEIAFTDVGGWDTHSNQGGPDGFLSFLLSDLASGIRAFRDDLGDLMERVVVLTMSEFGRTIEENGSGGTDHGHGTAMLALGGPINGGSVYGSWPGLDPDALYEGRDLEVTTDFRALFAEILSGHMGNTQLEVVFPGFEFAPEEALGIVKT